MNRVLESIVPAIPYIAAFIAAGVVWLFTLYRADNIRARKEFPTKLAVAQTKSTILNFVMMRRQIRGDVSIKDRRVAASQAELDATITPGTLRADDIPAPPPRDV